MTGKHAKPTLVRLWRDGFREELPGAWVDWQEVPGYPDAKFVLPLDHPMAKALHAAPICPINHRLITVYSTDELVWSVESMVWEQELMVLCEPYTIALRQRLRTDEYMAHVWLKAEKLWLKAEKRWQEAEHG